MGTFLCKNKIKGGYGMDNQTKDLTQGPIGRQVFFFALPLLGGSLIQQLYKTVDLNFV